MAFLLILVGTLNIATVLLPDKAARAKNTLAVISFVIVGVTCVLSI